MKESQYFILAEEIVQEGSGVFTYKKVCHHLYVDKLPAKGKFDFAIVCGPGWESGEHHLHVAVRVEDSEPRKIGYSKVKIIDNYHIFTTVVKEINIAIENEQTFYFMVYKHQGEFLENEDTTNMLTGDLIIERPFRVISVKSEE